MLYLLSEIAGPLLANLSQWNLLRKEESEITEAKEKRYLDALLDEGAEVHVSEVDRDPYGIMISRE